MPVFFICLIKLFCIYAGKKDAKNKQIIISQRPSYSLLLYMIIQLGKTHLHTYFNYFLKAGILEFTAQTLAILDFLLHNF